MKLATAFALTLAFGRAHGEITIPIESGAPDLQDAESRQNARLIAAYVVEKGHQCNSISNAAPDIFAPGYTVLRCDNKTRSYRVSLGGDIYDTSESTRLWQDISRGN